MVELDALTQLRGLSTAQAAAFVGEHPETFLRKVREGKRPPPDRVFGPRQRYWTVETLLRAARRNVAGKAPAAPADGRP